MGARLLFSQVKSYYESQSCQLLESEYRNNRTPMRYVCSCGQEDIKTFDKFQSGQKCRNCGSKTKGNKLRHSIEYIKQQFRAEGCELLESTYKHARQLLSFRCVCGTLAKIRWNSFQQGQRCQNCRRKKLSEGKRGALNPAWNPNREGLDEIKKFTLRCRKMVLRTLECMRLRKNNKTVKLLGYTPQQLREHIHAHPNWPSVKDGEWHIDHIFPVVAFIQRGIHDVGLINSLDNLQPLSAIENLKKHDEYDEKAFEVWLNGRYRTLRNQLSLSITEEGPRTLAAAR